MARASLEALLNDLLKKVGKTTYKPDGKVEQSGAELYRFLNSNIETHTLTINKVAIIAQVTDEMYHREGLGKHGGGRIAKWFGGSGGATTQKTAEHGGQSVLGSGKRKAGAKKELDKVINDEVPKLCNVFYDKILTLKDKTTGPYTVSHLSKGHKPENFTFSIAQSDKDKGGDVFRYIKQQLKQKAQKPMTDALTAWAKEYSQRDESKEMSRKIGEIDKKTGKGKYEGRVATQKETDAGISYAGNTKTIMVQKGFGPGESASDLGHMEGSSVSEKRQETMKGEVERYEGTQGELINLDEPNEKKAREFLKAFKGGKDRIKWTIGDYDKIGELEKTTKIEFEAPYLNSNVAKKGEDIGLEKYLLSLLEDLKDTDEWAHFEGSDSMIQKIDKMHKNALVKEIKGRKNIKRRNLEHRKIKRSKGRVKRGIKKNAVIGTIAAIKTNDKTKTRASFRKKASKGKSVRKQATAAAMPLELIGLINKELPDVVRANMGAPALTNITGRFAESTRATDIIMTPQGFPSIGYTYQRDPYGTFENDADYDPRRLIDRSMREIAAQYAIGRFYTRRV